MWNSMLPESKVSWARCVGSRYFAWFLTAKAGISLPCSMLHARAGPRCMTPAMLQAWAIP